MGTLLIRSSGSDVVEKSLCMWLKTQCWQQQMLEFVSETSFYHFYDRVRRYNYIDMCNKLTTIANTRLPPHPCKSSSLVHTILQTLTNSFIHPFRNHTKKNPIIVFVIVVVKIEITMDSYRYISVRLPNYTYPCARIQFPRVQSWHRTLDSHAKTWKWGSTKEVVNHTKHKMDTVNPVSKA